MDGSTEENRAAIVEDAIAYGLGSVALAIHMVITLTLAVSTLNWAAFKQINTVRKKFFESMMRKSASWYDQNANESFAVRLTE